MKYIILIFLISIYITGIDSWGKGIRKWYDKMFKKETVKSWHFAGADQSEYPGTNGVYRKLHAEKWEIYYECLKEQDAMFKGRSSPIPEAVIGFEGGFVKLLCKICISPKEKEKADTIEWEWSSRTSTHLVPVDPDDNILLSPEDKALHLFNLNEEQTGQYQCKIGNFLTVPYFLTVISNEEKKFKKVFPSEAPKGPYASEPLELKDYSLILDTEWTEWSSCSVCDKVGKRYKSGFCIVNLSGNETKNSSLPKQDIDLLKIFQFGLPCDSHILPKSIQSLKEVRERTNEVMKGFCKEPCPKPQIFEVKDKNGRVLEVANNTAGVYSLLQGLPPSQPETVRNLQYIVKGYPTIIVCPGNMNSDAPIQWQIAGQNVVPQLLEEESNGRIYVNTLDQIHIMSSLLHDSNLYSCWQHKELVGIVQLIVEETFQFNFNHHLMLFGMIVILSAILYVFFRAYMGRSYSKQGHSEFSKTKPLMLVDKTNE